jgi:hypothetical protein
LTTLAEKKFLGPNPGNSGKQVFDGRQLLEKQAKETFHEKQLLQLKRYFPGKVPKQQTTYPIQDECEWRKFFF